MCGIFGYVGNGPVRTTLVDGLDKLEYRGYDSAGIAIHKENCFDVTRSVGKVQKLREKITEGSGIENCGIAHTRWATHGAVSINNAHPHTSSDGAVCLAHNGVIDNAEALKEMLKLNDYGFDSDTDTEVIANLIALHLKNNTLPLKAVETAISRLKGTYGLAIMIKKCPNTIFFAKMGSPLTIGIKDGEHLLSSDTNALIQHTNRVIHLEDGNFGFINSGLVHIESLQNSKIPESEEISSEDGIAELGNFPNFMLKEIFEQPEAIRRCFGGRLREDNCILSGFGLNFSDLAAVKSICILGCGTSYHAGLVAKHFIENWSNIPVFVELASEFLCKKILNHQNCLYLAISQSGETYDTLECVKELKILGKNVFGVVNTAGSSIARICGAGVYIHAGPEVAVASTKAFTSQLAALFMFSIMLARSKGRNPALIKRDVEILRDLPRVLENYLKILENNKKQLKDVAKYIAKSPYCLFLGTGPLYPVALEGALKLKEIAYVPCEAYASGEMKHGPIAMICKGTPVVCLIPGVEKQKQKIATAIQEVKARGAEIIKIGHEINESSSDFFIERSGYCEPFDGIFISVVLQLIAYYAAVYKELDVDRPRNLAKSVTVG